MKVKQKGGQGRSRFGGPHRKDKNYEHKIRYKSKYVFLNQKIAANFKKLAMQYYKHHETHKNNIFTN